MLHLDIPPRSEGSQIHSGTVFINISCHLNKRLRLNYKVTCWLAEKLWATEACLNANVKAELDEAPVRVEEADQRVLHLEQEVNQLKIDLKDAKDHVASVVKDKRKLERAEFDLIGSKKQVCLLELNSTTLVIKLIIWSGNLRMLREMWAASATVKKHAQADHKNELKARGELIALLNVKLSWLNEHNTEDTEACPWSSSKGSECAPDTHPKKDTEPVSVDVRFACHCQPCLCFLMKKAGWWGLVWAMDAKAREICWAGKLKQ